MPTAHANRRALYVSLTPAQADALDHQEQRTGRSAAATAKLLLAQMLHEQEPPPNPEPVRRALLRDARQTLRLTKPEADLLKALAQRMNMSAHAYIVALLRSHMLRTPQPTGQEIEALDASTRELNAIGVNLNQLVRKAHEMNDFPTGLAPKIKQVADHMKKHAAAVNSVIRASVERWT